MSFNGYFEDWMFIFGGKSFVLIIFQQHYNNNFNQLVHLLKTFKEQKCLLLSRDKFLLVGQLPEDRPF
jgi:hypothetical protein